jgi:methionyl-tRNA synthetase
MSEFKEEKPAEGAGKEGITPYYIPKDASLVPLGAMSKNLPGHKDETYYITTAIAYCNGYPHIGHAYEFVTTDVLARYHRMFGYDTYFLTGSDEHGQKVASSAAKANRDPLEHCDIYVNGFKALNQLLSVSNDGYLRTTSIEHKAHAQKLWKVGLPVLRSFNPITGPLFC